MEIKAIETIYNGYRFRSRLEAKWAVFFDAIGMKYEFEPEGYTVMDGTKYLPDFYLPTEDMYVEVKGLRPEAGQELERVVKFVKVSNKNVVILSSVPNPKQACIWWYPTMWHQTLNNSVTMSRIALMFNPKAHIAAPHFITDFSVTYEHKNIALYNCEWNLNDRIKNNLEGYLLPKTDKWMYRNEYIPFDGETCYEDGFSKEELTPLFNAYTKARQARFEYGETPQIHSYSFNQ